MVDEGARGCGNRSCIGAVADRETELVIFDECLRRLPILHRYRDNSDALLGEPVRRSRKRGKLGIAVWTPGTAVEQDHTEATGQITRQMNFAATDADKGKGGKTSPFCNITIALLV